MIDTTNFTDTRIDDKTLLYRFTVEDPETSRGQAPKVGWEDRTITCLYN